MNDTEREQWVNNDERLYLWWKESELPLRAFVRQNRQFIDEVIQAVLEQEPA